MQTKATVISIDGPFATVEAERNSACDGCHKAEEGGCSVCTLMGSDRKIATRAINEIGAKVGDRVVIESHDGRMLWYAALVFIVPILATLLSWGLTALFTKTLLWQIAGGAFGFVVSFLVIFLYSKKISKSRCDVEIVEILKTED